MAPLLVTVCLTTTPMRAQGARDPARTAIEAFNATLARATHRMDNDATLALWEENGTSLLPSTPPIKGKAAIAEFMRKVTSSMPAAHMELFRMTCHDIAVSGDWASEWCTEHQVVRFADGRPPFDGAGKMLFVLHRGGDGRWRIRTEMWNQAEAVANAR